MVLKLKNIYKMVMEMVMKNFMLARRFNVADFTQLSDMPWVANQSLIIEASTPMEAWKIAVNTYQNKYNFKDVTWNIKEVTSEDPFFQNSWVRFFLKVNRGITV
jgi:hypothetical protein